MKYKFLVIVFSLIFTGHIAYAVDISNTGIIPDQIWYLPSELVEGEIVDIYTAIWNGSENIIKVKVEFDDKNVVLGSREIFVFKKSVKDVSVSWKVTAGDHSISAKIISSSISESGKTQVISLEKQETRTDKQFVAKVIKEIDGVPSTSNDLIRNEIKKAGSKISDVIPNYLQESMIEKLGFVDDFRGETLVKINEGKQKTKDRLDQLNNQNSSNLDNQENTRIDGTAKPIAMVKYFFLTIAGLIFANKIIFYGLCILVIFFIFRSIYRKIKGL